MKQEFNFSSSNNKLEDGSKIVDNNKATIKEQNFILNMSPINTRIGLFIGIIILFCAGFYFYQTNKIEEDKEKRILVHEKRIKALIKKKEEIMNQKFDREAARKEIDQLIKQTRQSRESIPSVK